MKRFFADAFVAVFLYVFFFGGTFVHLIGFYFYQWWIVILTSVIIHHLFATEILGEFDGSNEWEKFRHFIEKIFYVSSFSKYWRSDFPTSKSTEVNGQQVRVMFACHPHGVAPLSWAFSFAATNPYKPLLLSARIMFRFPITRAIAMWYGCVHASKLSFELTKNRNVIVLPGGIREMGFSKTEGDIVIVKRKGFIRTALTNPGGIMLVPVYGFGAEKLHSQITLRNDWMKNKFGVYPFFPIGQNDFLYPKHSYVCHISGNPIHVKYNPSFNESDVDEIYENFYLEMERLIKEHKKTCSFHSNVSVRFVNGEEHKTKNKSK